MKGQTPFAISSSRVASRHSLALQAAERKYHVTCGKSQHALANGHLTAVDGVNKWRHCVPSNATTYHFGRIFHLVTAVRREKTDHCHDLRQEQHNISLPAVATHCTESDDVARMLYRDILLRLLLLFSLFHDFVFRADCVLSIVLIKILMTITVYWVAFENEFFSLFRGTVQSVRFLKH